MSDLETIRPPKEIRDAEKVCWWVNDLARRCVDQEKQLGIFSNAITKLETDTPLTT